MRHQAGISLIEAMIAIVILGFGILATTKMQLNMSIASQLSRQRAEATLMATNELEKARAKGCTALSETQLAAAAQASAQYKMQIDCSAGMTVTIRWKDVQTKAGDTENQVVLVSQF
ncbi:type IV pilus modification PilV family protein [Aeromonas media]|uniref:Prepilin-type N-terminal cleavage/methylation domain-containing protein n=1 Tax=Aeromonas media TaxID=651 RepID=A0AAW5RIK4_AERME|nr:prepilin-type N-terminal cleavage/methylation domain-containing protein [Aeromonas media]MBS4639849.1 prepilin-type N-terminal cleavage/methylation domain-containing protein [Aeromonas media]MCV3287048.1 prepilin-type N-terminal cleavage/methylation domain-containing protein [Aeromonas media]